MTNAMSATKNSILVSVFVGLMTGTPLAQAAEITTLMSKDLTDIPGQEVLMVTVEKAPGASGPMHQWVSTLNLRNNAHGFFYVLEGSMKMQVGNGKEVTLTQGQSWYEGPQDIHSIARNASTTQPVKFLVFFVMHKPASASAESAP